MENIAKAYELVDQVINYANEAKELAKDVENEKAQNEADDAKKIVEEAQPKALHILAQILKFEVKAAKGLADEAENLVEKAQKTEGLYAIVETYLLALIPAYQVARLNRLPNQIIVKKMVEKAGNAEPENLVLELQNLAEKAQKTRDLAIKEIENLVKAVECQEKENIKNLVEKVENLLIEAEGLIQKAKKTKNPIREYLLAEEKIIQAEKIALEVMDAIVQLQNLAEKIGIQADELKTLAQEIKDKKAEDQADKLKELIQAAQNEKTVGAYKIAKKVIDQAAALQKKIEKFKPQADKLKNSIQETQNAVGVTQKLAQDVLDQAPVSLTQILHSGADAAKGLAGEAEKLFVDAKETEDLAEKYALAKQAEQKTVRVYKIATKIKGKGAQLEKIFKEFQPEENEAKKLAQEAVYHAQKMAEETRAKALEILVQTVHFKAETVQIPLVKAQTQVEQARNTENLFYGYKLAEKAMKKAHKAYKLASECINYANEAKELAKDVENEKAQNEAKKVQVDAFDSIASTIYAEGIKKAENLVKLAKETKTSIFSIPAFTTQQLGLYALTGDVIHKTGRLQNLFKQFQPEGNEVKKPSKAQTYKLKALNQDAQRLVKKAKHQAIDKVETQASKTQKIVQRAQYLVQIISERINDEKGILLEEKETYDLLKDVKSNAKNLNALAEEVKGQADVLKKLAQNFEKEGAQNLEAAIQYLITISKDLDTKAEDLAKKTIDLETLTTNPKIKKYISKSLESLKNLNCVKTELLTKLMIPKLLSINRVKQAKNEVQEAKSKKQEAEKEAHEAESKKQQAEKEAHEAESKKEGKNKQANTANNQFKKIHEKAQNLEQAMKKAENLKNIVENLIAKLEKFYQAKEKAENARKAAKYEAEEDAKQAEKEFKEAKLLIPTLKWRFYNIFRDKLKNLKDLDVLVNQKFKKAEEEFKKAEQESKKAEQESKKAQKEVDDAQKKVDDAQKKVDDAQKKVDDAQE
ncbi:hypothetical protein DI09_236p10, partial [Mitosporidium daphniae]